MTFPFAALIDPAVWSGAGGAGGAALGLVVGHVKTRNGRIAKLEKEVEECRRRDADFRIISAGVRLMVGELRDKIPDSQALKMFGDLMEQRLGPPPTAEDFDDLIGQIDKADEEYRREQGS